MLVGHVMKRGEFGGELTRASQAESRAVTEEKEGGVMGRETECAKDRSEIGWEGPGGVACRGEHHQHSRLQVSLQREE